MNHNDFENILHSSLKNTKSKVQIFEEGIDINTQINFQKLTKKYLKSDTQQRDFSLLENELFNESVEANLKKDILIELSLLEEVRAYRLIEKFYAECENDLKTWTALALQKSRVHIEHALSSEDKIYISSGLGGQGDKLRYFFVLSSKDNKPFNQFHKNIITNEIKFSITKFDGIVEKINFTEFYVTIICMLPFSNSLEEVFGTIHNECNKLGGFLSEKIIATNTEILNHEAVTGILNEVPKSLDLFDGSIPMDLEDDFFDDEDFDEEDFDDDILPF